MQYTASRSDTWPSSIKEFLESGESERFALSGPSGERLDYLVRRGDDIWVYSRELGNVRMQEITDQYRHAREIVADARERDLRRGLTITLIILVVAVWFVCVGVVRGSFSNRRRFHSAFADGRSAFNRFTLLTRPQTIPVALCPSFTATFPRKTC